MQIAVDKFGRVLIPKKIRDHLGIKPGCIIRISERDHEILLQLPESKVQLEREKNVLVFTGEARGDIESAIQEEREQRMKDLY